MTDLIITLIEEHRRLNAMMEEMERMITGLNEPVGPVLQKKFRGLIDPLIELLKVHGELESIKLFPILKKRIPEADQWQIRMVEVQDEMILAEARHLQELFAGPALPPPAGRVRESGAHLVRWIREHIMIEEQNLFTRIEGFPVK